MTDFASHGIDHLNIGVSNPERLRDVYVAALAPLGVTLILSIPPERAEPGGDQQGAGGWMFGFAERGKPHKPFFRLLGDVAPARALHIAFSAQNRSEVDAFHTAVLAAGGTDNGAPGVRHYHPDYYGAFIRDPDGNNIEAVCHAPA